MTQGKSVLFQSCISLPQPGTAVWMTQKQLDDRLPMADGEVTHFRKASAHRLYQQQSAALNVIIAPPTRHFASSGKCSAHREKGKEV